MQATPPSTAVPLWTLGLGSAVGLGAVLFAFRGRVRDGVCGLVQRARRQPGGAARKRPGKAKRRVAPAAKSLGEYETVMR